MFFVQVNHGCNMISIDTFDTFEDALDNAYMDQENILDHGGIVDIDVLNAEGKVLVSLSDDYSFEG